MPGREVARKLAVVLTDRIQSGADDLRAKSWPMGRYPYTGAHGTITAPKTGTSASSVRPCSWWPSHLELEEPGRSPTLSDGQRQRVHAGPGHLSGSPRCIAPGRADRPIWMSRHKIRFLEILRRLATERGIAVVLSMHELEFVRKISDEMACIKEGRILKAGAPEEILTEALIEELFDLPAELYRAYFTSGAL